jgi:hypothetical protein
MMSAFDGDFDRLVRSMRAAGKHLDELPDDQEWTQDALATLDDVRHEALRRCSQAEAVIKDFMGVP